MKLIFGGLGRLIRHTTLPHWPLRKETNFSFFSETHNFTSINSHKNVISALFLRLTRLICLIGLTETKLIFASYERLTRFTNVVIKAHRNETHFCLFSETHKTHKQSLIFSNFVTLTRLTNCAFEAHRNKYNFWWFSETRKTHKCNSWSS